MHITSFDIATHRLAQSQAASVAATDFLSKVVGVRRSEGTFVGG